MAFISVTYSFTNGTTADATQVNQNFSDLINGTSDGTKDFSVAALTAAGTATLSGAVIIGGVITIALGSNSAPAYSFTGDANTGMYSSAADTINFAANGTSRMQIGASAITVGISGTPGKVFGRIDGSVQDSGYIGERVTSTLSTSVTASGADTYTDAGASGQITVSAGTWLLGYDVTLDTTRTSGTFAANIAIRTGSSVVTGTEGVIRYGSASGIGGDGVCFSVSRCVVVAVSGSTTYKLSIRSSDTTSNTAVIIATNVSSGLTDPDTTSNIWAIRIA